MGRGMFVGKAQVFGFRVDNVSTSFAYPLPFIAAMGYAHARCRP